MNLPDDFGLGAVETLSHVATTDRAACHVAFWSTWNEVVFSRMPRLVRRSEPDPSDATAAVEFESTDHVRIGCRLFGPPEGTPVRAGLVASHGYRPPPPLAEESKRWEPIVQRGVAVLAIRLRGYPGSQLDVGNLTGKDEGWITHGLGSSGPEGEAHGGGDWIVSGAVADVVNACRALRRDLGGRGGGVPAVPIYLHGRSLGGGLAIVAASQLAGRDDVQRVVVALPSLGDWPWRLDHPTHAGIGAHVHALLRTAPDRVDAIVTTLRLFDAAVHARRVRCPLLCKLAVRDDVVPAPCAAAVYNAIGTDPALKWRWVVAFGHFEGGIAAARRHALFDRLVADFLDPAMPPRQAMQDWNADLSPRLPG